MQFCHLILKKSNIDKIVTMDEGAFPFGKEGAINYYLPPGQRSERGVEHEKVYSKARGANRIIKHSGPTRSSNRETPGAR